VTGPSQYSMDFGVTEAYSATDFLVAPCNATAHGWLTRWPDWPSFGLALCGPEGCGKTHLVHIFREHSAGVVVAGPALTKDAVPDLERFAAVVVDDADRCRDETALFHLHNLVRESGHSLLLTGIDPPARWPLDLADLRSRLAALTVATVEPPDDALLHAVLLKLFADRQIRVAPDIPAYLVPRMERSFAAARALVDAIDRHALSLGRAVTVPLVREVL